MATLKAKQIINFKVLNNKYYESDFTLLIRVPILFEIYLFSSTKQT